MQQVEPIRSENYRDQDIITLARIVVPETLQPAVTADFSSVTLDVFDLSSKDAASATVYSTALDLADIFFDVPVVDELWNQNGAVDDVGYNFMHALLRPSNLFDCGEGHTLLLRYQFNRSDEDRSPLWVVHERRLLPNGWF